MEVHKKIPCDWSPDLAYLVGLIATDDNLSSHGRHVNLTSKDADLLEEIRDCFHLRVKVGKKSRIKGDDKIYSILQIGDVKLKTLQFQLFVMENQTLFKF